MTITQLIERDTEHRKYCLISNLEGIAFALGCMFDPTSCQEKKELGKTEEGK